LINCEKEYQNSRNFCGEPFPEIVEFFENSDNECATVLYSGCGQGRDALFIAHKGHSVLGVDTAQTGIEQRLKETESKNLAVDGVIADITNYKAYDLYNIVVIDRVLHMLQNE
jgi:2-polyprenyl-3-methyl-5-hydroxy-6-metoxy-1,4-benzoquinol methylase